MKIKTILIVCLLSVLSVGVSWSENSAAIPEPPVSQSDFRVLGFEIENSSIKQVRSKLGYARRFKSMLHHDEEGICYISPNGQTLVEFRTGWPGGWEDLIGFRVSSLISDPIRANCLKSKALPNSVTTASGLQLGMTKDDVIAKFGNPKSISGEKLTYYWEEIRKMNSEELKAYKDADPTRTADDAEIGIVTLMEFEFASSKLVSFTIYHTETT